MTVQTPRPLTDPIDRGREIATIAVTAIAILLFVGLGGTVLSGALHNAMNAGAGGQVTLDRSLLIALYLNIALILFGWRRQRDRIAAIGIATPIDERAQPIVSRDPLTGFLNRRSLAEQGAAMFVHAHRRDKAMALLMIDLDRFRTVNDAQDHDIDDALIRAVARSIGEAMPHGALIARLIDDQFACAFLFDCDHPDTVDRIAERLVSRMGQAFTVDGLKMRLSAAIGVARSDIGCASIDALLRAAGMAMDAARRSGSNRHRWFDRSMEQALHVRGILENDLRNAVPRQEITPMFDPQINLATGDLLGFEVLPRWDHPTQGMIPAKDWLLLAEQTGLIADIAASALRRACIAARDWDAGLTLSFNASPWQLRNPWFAQRVIQIATETGFPPSRLECEITEGALLGNLALAQSILQSLKNQGIAIVLAKFGTGYSSLTHLHAVPLDRIKIDQGLTGTLVDDPASAAIVNAIARLGESLHIVIAAEGIADMPTAERLRIIGCTRGQGPLYGGPIGLAQVRAHLAGRRLLVSQAGERRAG